jgi:hypothetical protein
VSSHSAGHEGLAHRVWHLHVGLLVLVTSATLASEVSRTQIIFPTRSWEFVSTLNYEWSIIRGHERYRWTIWVRDDRALLC